MSDLVVRKWPVRENRGGCSTHTGYAVSEEKECRRVGKFLVRQDRPGLVVAVSTIGKVNRYANRHSDHPPRWVAVLDTPFPVRKNVHIV